MADNVVANAGAGGATFASDDILGVQYPRTKVVWGVDGSAVDASATNPLPVVQTGTHTVTGAGGTFPVTDSGGSLTVDGSVSITGAVDTELTTADLDTGAGTDTRAVVGLVLAASGGGVLVGSANPLPVSDNGGNLSIDDGGNSITVDGTVTVSQGTAANLNATVVGTGTFAVQESGGALTALQLIDNAVVDHGAAAVAGVRPIGLEGRNTEPTAVDAGDAVRALATLLGKQINVPYSIPASTWSYAAASGGITDTTGVTAKAAAGVGIRNYITRVQVVNGHATTSTDVQIRDGAAGTVLWRGFAQAAGGGVSAVFDPPLRGTANTLVEVACGTTGTATYFNLQGFVAAE